MKRLLPAVLAALFLHGLFFYLLPTWAPSKHPPRLSRAPVTFTLSYRNSPKDPPPPPPKPLLQEKPPTNTLKIPPVPTPKPRPKTQALPTSPPKTLKSPAPQRVLPLPLPPKSSPAPGPEAVVENQAKGDPDKETSPEGSLPAPPPPPPPPTGDSKVMGTAPPSPPLLEAVPLYRENPPPPYPLTARRRGQEGTVLIEVLVDRAGRVKDFGIRSTSGYPLLDKAAMKAVSRWRFEPGKRGHEPVEMWVTVPVRFHLK